LKEEQPRDKVVKERLDKDFLAKQMQMEHDSLEKQIPKEMEEPRALPLATQVLSAESLSS
jgi:hypothetical protein